ncbi:MAG: NADH-quinone oxidoreductase subunit NuoH [Halieaceae bacterium]|nr:NADH-quinone oxidoreductase subunit NuoH [Halieaceae bacterium]
MEFFINDILYPLLNVVGVLVGAIGFGAVTIWIERRMLGVWQDRLGPNRIGPLGIGQVVADMIKIFFKEDWIPPFSDKVIFVIAPTIIMCVAMISFAVIPITPEIGVADDLNIGLLFFLAMMALGVYSALLGGFASDNKLSLLGTVRAAAQSVGYEVYMGLSLMGVVMLADSFSIRDIVEAQEDMWFVIPQFFGFLVFAIAGMAESHRAPFDIPEAETELAAGFHTEYSGMKFGMFFVGEYVGVVLASLMMAVLFFGGWHGPFLPPLVWIFLKTLFFVLFFILVRSVLPRPRYDQLMAFGWKVMLPLSLANLVITAGIVLAMAD